MGKHFVIIDEHIVNKSGHYYTYNKSCIQIFEQLGYTTHLYGQQALLPQIVSELKATPHFAIKSKPWYRSIPILGAIIYRIGFWQNMQRQITDVLNKHNASNAVYFFPNVYWYNILPIVKAISNTSNPCVLLLRNPLSEFLQEPQAFAPIITKLMKYAFGKVMLNKNVKFATDSEVIAQEYLQWHPQSSIAVLPIPHVPHEPIVPLNASSAVNIYAPGVMRLEKGAQFIAQGLHTFAQQYPQWHSSVTIQAQFFGDKEYNEMQAVQQQLQQLPFTVQILGSLDTETYKNTFAHAHILLIPYDPNCGYRARTSGILAESIASGKVFVTSQHTWMSLQANKYNIGACVPYNDAKAFADGLHQLLINFEQEQQKVLNVVPHWLAFHSHQGFAKVFMGVLDRQ
jgi:glycosyltransferase involved in cell wall biosynthesis